MVWDPDRSVRLGIVVFAIVQAVNFGSAQGVHAQEDDPLRIAVSLVQLIANPSAFDGKRVLVVGYMTMDFENTAIWLNELDGRHVITKNGVWLDVDAGDQPAASAGRASSRLHKRYGLVVGTFNAQRRGHLGLFSGAIEGITRLEPRN